MKKIKNVKGFTLIELLVVVLIIGILAAISLPQYQMVAGKAKFATLKENAHTIKSAVDRLYMVSDRFWGSFEGLDIDLQGDLVQHDKMEIKDGSRCQISTAFIYCKRKIFGVTMSYDIKLNSINDRRCTTLSNDSNDKSHRLCKLETGKKNATIGENTYRY